MRNQGRVPAADQNSGEFLEDTGRWVQIDGNISLSWTCSTEKAQEKTTKEVSVPLRVQEEHQDQKQQGLEAQWGSGMVSCKITVLLMVP